MILNLHYNILRITFHMCIFLFYRKYIENVLKTRGLKKSLYFLERLHMTILSKASMTLEKPNEQFKLNDKEEYESEQEAIRYGVWSQEAADLNLPSYR